MERTIVAFCFDLRGYRQFLAQDPQQLAEILQYFVEFIVTKLDQLSLVEQLTLQGDAVIGVCRCDNQQQFREIITTLEAIMSYEPDLQVQLTTAELPKITFGLGIDYGTVLPTPTCIPGANGMLYVGRVISTAIRLSDLAARPPQNYCVVASEAAKAAGLRTPVRSENEAHYYFTELLETSVV